MPDLLLSGRLFLPHSTLLGLDHDERHPHSQGMCSCIHERMRFQRSHRIDALVFHRFQNLRLFLGESVIGSQGFRVLEQTPAQRLAEAQIEEQLVERINCRIGMLIELISPALEWSACSYGWE